MSEFRLPTYYNDDETLEVVAFFARDTGDKYSALTIVSGKTLDVSLNINTSQVVSGVPSTIKITLPDAESEEIGIRVSDSGRDVLHETTVTTND